MSLKPKVRVPKLTLPYFDGESQNADRWMAALKQDFGAQDMDREDYPSLWLEAIYSRVSGKAENRDNATMIEVERFETEFRSRFPGSLTADPQPSNFLELWSSAGGRRTQTNDPMFNMGCQVIVQGFVSGLFEESVKLKAIENGAMGVTSLEDAINKVNSAVQTLQHLYLYGPQAGIAWKALSQMNQRSFLPNSQAYVSAINYTNSMPAAQIFPSSLDNRYDYSPNAFYKNTQPQHQPPLQPFQVFPPQTSQPVANNLALLPPSTSNTNPSSPPGFIQRSQQFSESHKAQQSSRYQGPPRPQQDNRPLPVRRELPSGFDPSQSRHPVVNGTIPFGLHCFKCGELGHPSRECPTPNALSQEERAALYNRYVDRVLSSHQRQVNLAEAHQSVHPHMSFDTKRDTPNIPRKNAPCSSKSQPYEETNESYESDFLNYPLQTYEEATGQKERINSRVSGNAVDSIEVGNDTREHLSNDDQLSFSTRTGKGSKISEPSPVNTTYNLLDDNSVTGLVTEELDLLNFSGSLEHFSVVSGQEKRRSIKDIFDDAHAEVMDVHTSRKRRHVELENLSNSEDMDDNHQFHQKGPKLSPGTKKKELKAIFGRKDEGPLDYKSMLSQTMITMSVLEFCQASPDAAKHFRHLVTRENKKRGRKRTGNTKADVGKIDYPISQLKWKEPLKSKGIPREARPFRLNTACIISNQKTRVTFQRGTVQADQGSDLNLISNSLVNDLKLERRSLNNLMGFSMQTADGSITQLNDFAVLIVGVGNIYRKIHAFIRPELSNQPDSTSLLLGLPWLYSVDATIKIRDFSLTIGDPIDDKYREKERTVLSTDLPVPSSPIYGLHSTELSLNPQPNLSKIIPYPEYNSWEEYISKVISIKFPWNLSSCLWPEIILHCKVLHIPLAKQNQIDTESLLATLNYNNSHNINIPFPTTRRPCVRKLSEEPIDVINKWFATCGAIIHLSRSARR
ncbi:hypothetical protein OnM2_000012 [Erysiphe neolycopersici]|uniref:CCHC-type domain-containing protein n=1 Tax=Erysiphe neolycopersici TaxID=212602 RepID=A0A420I8I9_9PEZI|nr:hypothetical protein OnM2_000012 [Erysiphe neolycopersici]